MKCFSQKKKKKSAKYYKSTNLVEKRCAIHTYSNYHKNNQLRQLEFFGVIKTNMRKYLKSIGQYPFCTL